MLAAFAAEAYPIAPAHVAYDLGAGVGAVGLALLFFGAATRVVLVEIDTEAAEVARANIDANGWSERAACVEGDARDVARAHGAEADLVVCNPPYFEPGRGRAPKTPSRARAREGELSHFTTAARALLGRRGRACFVYPAGELATLTSTLRDAGLEPKRLRFVHASAEAPARVVLVEAVAGKPGGLRVAPPVIERTGDGYTPELTALLAGEREGARVSARRP